MTLLETERRWHSLILLSLALVLCLLRFAWLRADFPNHSPWLIDQAKYTDEGWWANAAVRHFLIGHWREGGDYNPAVVVPVWPALLTVLFETTGVSIAAARALNVTFSVATVLFVYLLVRRYGGTRTTASIAAVLLAASPFAFVYSRLAILDTVVVFEWVLLCWAASFLDRRGWWLFVAVSFLAAAMMLTKTTSLVLLPSVLWLIFRKRTSALFWVSVSTGGMVGLYFLAVLRSKYAGDCHYFFNINSLPDVVLGKTGWWLDQLFHNGRWIDRLLYPASLVVFVLSVAWVRQLWKNPLFVASWIALAGNAVYILRRQNDFAPRYFLVMLVPVILVVALALQELEIRHRSLATVLACTLAVALVLDMAQVLGFLTHRQYQYYGAARSIEAIVHRDPQAHRLLLGTSGDQLSLMTGIPAINDEYSSQDLTEKVDDHQPGWYVNWNDLDDDIVSQLPEFRLEQVASFPVFDHENRNELNLYRMIPIPDAGK